MNLKKIRPFVWLLGLLAVSQTAIAQTPTPGEEIDMGVSVSWRGYNIGAESSSDKGTLYAFASTKAGGYNSYTMYNYPFYNYSTNGFKLPEESIAGNVEYDAAAANTEGHWRLATRDEWEELFANCTSEYTAIEGTSGYLLTSKTTGNSIFLASSTVGYSKMCCYYTSESNGSLAYVATVTGSGGKVSLQAYSMMEGTGPFVGLPLRAVCDSYSGPALEAIELTIAKSEIFAGTSTTVTATSVPEGVPMKLNYTSSDESVATVTKKGVVRGIGNGTATITATSDDISATVQVTVVKVDTPADEEFVDMGLSVDWCSHNFGTEALFGLGEKYPFAYITPDVLDKAFSYKFYNYPKYSFPKVDMYGDPLYDAVAAKEGAGSLERLPSEAELKELLEKCELEFFAASGDTPAHARLTSTVNGKSICLPMSENGLSVILYTGSANAAKDNDIALIIDSTKGTAIAASTSQPWKSQPLRAVREHPQIPALESIELNCTEATIYAENTVRLTATANPVGAVFTDLLWTSADETIATVSADGVVTGMSAGTVAITATDGAISASATITVEQLVLSEGDAIDMGLSVLWASCELGATTPSQPGARYSWGGTTPGTGDTEATWVDPGINNIAGTEFDAAHAELGGRWRMPTRSEITEFASNVRAEWLTYGGHRGVVLTSTVNGAKIFCPLPEGRSNVSYFGDVITLNATSTGLPAVECAYFDPTTCQISYESPWTLLPIRPIQTKIPPLESIVLDKTELALLEGETAQLSATPNPADAEFEGLVWSSDNESVATVSADGLVTAIGGGSATITVAVGEISAKATVTVTPLLRSITLDKTDIELIEGETAQITATPNPAGAPFDAPVWTSSDATVATVSADGLVTAIGGGSAIIRVQVGYISATATVTVTPSLKSIVLNKTAIELYEGDSVQLTASPEPTDAYFEGVAWTSDNESIATVNAEGLVKAIASGVATITATAGNVSASASITVKKHSGLADILVEQPGVEIYTIDGRRIDGIPGAGLYIIRRNDGTTTKIVVR